MFFFRELYDQVLAPLVAFLWNVPHRLENDIEKGGSI